MREREREREWERGRGEENAKAKVKSQIIYQSRSNWLIHSKPCLANKHFFLLLLQKSFIHEKTKKRTFLKKKVLFAETILTEFIQGQVVWSGILVLLSLLLLWFFKARSCVFTTFIDDDTVGIPVFYFLEALSSNKLSCLVHSPWGKTIWIFSLNVCLLIVLARQRLRWPITHFC